MPAASLLPPKQRHIEHHWQSRIAISQTFVIAADICYRQALQ
jgi:hypothetical protein